MTLGSYKETTRATGLPYLLMGIAGAFGMLYAAFQLIVWLLIMGIRQRRIKTQFKTQTAEI